MRSEFQPIATTAPGVRVCEHLPRLSRLMSHCTLVRSVHHDQVAHAPAVYTALTGVYSNVRAGIVGAKPTDPWLKATRAAALAGLAGVLTYIWIAGLPGR